MVANHHPEYTSFTASSTSVCAYDIKAKVTTKAARLLCGWVARQVGAPVYPRGRNQTVGTRTASKIRQRPAPGRGTGGGMRWAQGSSISCRHSSQGYRPGGVNVTLTRIWISGSPIQPINRQAHRILLTGWIPFMGRERSRGSRKVLGKER
jgi:hypothetical protein